MMMKMKNRLLHLWMIYLLGLEISSETYVKQYNRVYSTFLLLNDQFFLFLLLPTNSCFGQTRKNIYNFNTGGGFRCFICMFASLTAFITLPL